MVVGRHIAPAQQNLALRVDGPFDFLLTSHPRRGFARQEHHADAILTDGRQRQALLATDAPKMLIGKLNQDARAIAEQGVITCCAAVRKIFENLQPLLHERVRTLALDVGHKPDTTGVVFMARIVQTLRRRCGRGASLNCGNF